MAGLDNPFGQLLNPDRQEPGTLTNFLSKLSGQQSGAAVAGSEAVQSIMTAIQQGTPPQKAVVDFFATPQGAQAFINNPGIFDTIAKTIQQATPPNPMAIQTPAGARSTIFQQGRQIGEVNQPTTENQNFNAQGRVVQTPAGGKSTVMGPNGQVQAEVTNPPADVQTFNEMGKIAALPADKLSQLAEANMLVGGRYQVQPEVNSYGEKTGQFFVFDKLTGQVMTQTGAATGRQQPAENQPGVTTVPNDMRTPDGAVDVNKLVAGKAGMFLGSGLWPQIVGGLNSAMGSFIHPSLGVDAGRVANQQRANLEDLKTAVVSFPQVVGRTNKLIDQITKNLDFGMFSDPLDAVRNGINMYDDIQREISSHENTIKDMTLPKEVRVDASKEIQAYNRILRAMPSRGEMVEMEKAIRGNKIPGLGVSGAVQATKEATTKSTGAVKNVVQGGEPVDGNPEATAPGTAPGTQAQPDIAKMTPAQLLTLNPKTLTTPQRIQLQQRLKAILKPQP